MESPDSTVLNELLRLAEAAARAGGAVAREAFGRRIAVTLKSDASEVTEADVAAQHATFEVIRKARPADALFGEESEISPASSSTSSSDEQRIEWVVDPIDGTRNFIRGVPQFCCSVAALFQGWPVAGAIYDPMSDRMYSAMKSGGATVSGGATAGGVAIPSIDAAPSPGQVRNPSPLVAIPSAWKPETAARVRWIVENCVVRSLGSATLHLVQVATGGVDATLMNNCKLWDIAAGWIIVAEAGGLATRPDGQPLFPVNLAKQGAIDMPLLAGAPQTHASLLQAFARLS